MIKLPDSENKTKQKSNQTIISVRELTKKYENIVALDQFSFDIHKGEIFCLVGPNGAGKSTFVKLLTGQIKPTGGTILIEGKDPVKDRKVLLGDFGLVSQEIALYRELTGRENLEFHGRLYGIYKNDLGEKVDHMLTIAGLKNRQDDLVRTYSGGMMRRLQLVRAMLHAPQILILDEPTLGIDVQSRKAIHDYIMELAQKGMTIILTTNYMEEAEKLADRIIIIDTKMVAGPDRLQKIQERYFPETIFEFKAKKDSLDSSTLSTLLPMELIENFHEEKQISEEESLFRITFQSKNLQDILEQFLAHARKSNISIEEFTLKKSTLEDVFLKLTGKEFRE